MRATRSTGRRRCRRQRRPRAARDVDAPERGVVARQHLDRDDGRCRRATTPPRTTSRSPRQHPRSSRDPSDPSRRGRGPCRCARLESKAMRPLFADHAGDAVARLAVGEQHRRRSHRIQPPELVRLACRRVLAVDEPVAAGGPYAAAPVTPSATVGQRRRRRPGVRRPRGPAAPARSSWSRPASRGASACHESSSRAAELTVRRELARDRGRDRRQALGLELAGTGSTCVLGGERRSPASQERELRSAAESAT